MGKPCPCQCEPCPEPSMLRAFDRYSGNLLWEVLNFTAIARSPEQHALGVFDSQKQKEHRLPRRERITIQVSSGTDEVRIVARKNGHQSERSISGGYLRSGKGSQAMERKRYARRFLDTRRNKNDVNAGAIY